MYKNPIFGDNIPQKTIKLHPDIIFFQNSLKYSKYASISPTIFSQKIHPTLPVCYSNLRRWGNHMGRWGVRRNCSWLTAAQKVAMSAVSSSRRSAWAKRLRQKRCIHTQKITSGM